MAQPPEILALSDELRGFTERAWQQLQDTQNAVLDSWPQASRDARRQRLQDLKDTAARLTSQVDELALALATGGIHTAYTMGAEAGGITQYTAVDVEALGVLAQDLYDGVLAATKGVNASTKLLIRTLAREHVGDRLLGGQTSQDAARALRADLEGKGVYSVTYKDGSRQGLASYTDMLVRSQSALAYSTGTLNAARKAGTGYMEVFDSFDCGLASHTDSFKPNGLILPIEQCATYTISHPRCVMPGQRFASYGDLTECLRARYRGPAFTFETGVGSLTVGPHHPVMTGRGWLPAHLVSEGDELVYDGRLGAVVDSGFAAGLDLEEVPLVEDAFIAAGESTRHELGGDDLHGDAIFCEDEVDVVTPAGPLLHIPNLSIVEKLGELLLMWPDRELVPVSAERPVAGVFVGLRPVRARGPGISHTSDPLFGAGSLPSHRQAGAQIATDARPTRQAGDVRLGASISGSDLRAAHPTAVVLDELYAFGSSELPVGPVGARLGAELGVRGGRPSLGLEGSAASRADSGHGFYVSAVHGVTRTHYDGWVYDFSTTEGAFNVGGFVVKNCQRSFGPRPDVTSADEAKDAPRSQTPEQAADQKQVAQARQARVEQRAQRLAARRAKLDQRAGASA